MGIVLVLVAVVLSWTVEAAARGRVGVNPLIGIRVGDVTASPEAWRAGHRAARPLTHTASAVAAGTGVLISLPSVSENAAGWSVIAACLLILGLVVAGAMKANRAARDAILASLASSGRL